MRKSVQTTSLIAAVLLLGGCGAARPAGSAGSGDVSAARRAAEGYVAAINANDVERWSALWTEDVAFNPPNEPARAGKAAVKDWVGGFLAAYTIKIEETQVDFIVEGDWAIDRYTYRETDTPRAGGPAVQDTGKGVYIFHREKDGVWRLHRDIWNSDLAPAK